MVIKMSSDDVVSVTEAAKMLGKPRMTIYRWAEKGKIHALLFHGTLYIPKTEVDRLQEELNNEKVTAQ